MSQFILSIDQGTTSSRAILFDQSGCQQLVKQKELALFYPESGWVEQDAEAIWQDTLWACQSVYQAMPEALSATCAIGITNQRETTIVWNRQTGKPVYNAIVWQDRRTAKLCEQLKQQGCETLVTEKTGLLLDPYFSATKIAWILDHVTGARQQAEAGELAFGTVDCFLLWHLTGGKVHCTDATNASRTALFDIEQQEWSKELLELFNIPASLLPEVKDNATEFGVSEKALLGASLPIRAMIGDQQAALVGQACFEQGMVKSTYGTGCFMLMNTGYTRPHSQQRLLSTIAYRLDGKPSYAVEGAIFVAGAAVQWLRDGMQFIEQASQSEALATSVDDTAGVYLVPAFTGLGAPYWQPEAKGLITGLERNTTLAHIVRAALEAQAYQTRDLLLAMESDTGQSLALMRADGGLVANQFVCQFLADILGVDVQVPKNAEATAWGAASLAGLQSGLFADHSELERIWQLRQQYQPAMPSSQAQQYYSGWKRAVAQVLAGLAS